MRPNPALERTHLSAASRAQARRSTWRSAARGTVGCMHREYRASSEHLNLRCHLAWLARAPHPVGPAGLNCRCPLAASREGEPSRPARLGRAPGHGRAASISRRKVGRWFWKSKAKLRTELLAQRRNPETSVRALPNPSLNRTHLSAASRAQARRLVQRYMAPPAAHPGRVCSCPGPSVSGSC
jgi:hypothetical protein